MKNQSGFTLIELIMVIVILGILAATALPKFTDLAKDARVAKLNAARSAVLAASGIIHGTVLARGRIDQNECPGETLAASAANNERDADGTVCTEDGIVSTTYGYPIAGTVGAATVANTGIINAAGLTSDFRPITLAQLNAEGYGVAVDSGTVTFSVIGGSGTTGAVDNQVNTTCKFTYTESAGQGAAPVVSGIDIAGC